MNKDTKHNADQEAGSENNQTQKDRIHIGHGGLHITDEHGDEVHIDRNGLHVNEAGQNQVHIDREGVKINGETVHVNSHIHRHSFPILALVTLFYVIWVLVISVGHFSSDEYNLYAMGLLLFLLVPLGHSIIEAVQNKRFPTGIFSLLCFSAFLLAGFFFSAWHPAWLLLLFIPLIESIPPAVREKNGHKFAFWDLALILFLFLGFAPSFGFAEHGLWHPGWVVFLLIPVYHSFVSYLSKK
ncbi:MAG: hypothetical protein HFE78_01855 [Clostridiales bacterium]|nr:hypothetical protein [Clostridiales bacterium]